MAKMCIRDRYTLQYLFSHQQVSFLKVFPPLPSVPVSYTHLDVYKRQDWGTVNA